MDGAAAPTFWRSISFDAPSAMDGFFSNGKLPAEGLPNFGILSIPAIEMSYGPDKQTNGKTWKHSLALTMIIRRVSKGWEHPLHLQW